MTRKQSAPNCPKISYPLIRERTFFRTNGKTDEYGPGGFKTKAIPETLKEYDQIVFISYFNFSIALH